MISDEKAAELIASFKEMAEFSRKEAGEEEEEGTKSRGDWLYNRACMNTWNSAAFLVEASNKLTPPALASEKQKSILIEGLW